MIRSTEVVGTPRTEAAFVADETAQDEQGGDENPERRGVEDRIDGETDEERLARQWIFVAVKPIPELILRLCPIRRIDAIIPVRIDKQQNRVPSPCYGSSHVRLRKFTVTRQSSKRPPGFLNV